jgi:class 3 adenylate cyclase/tetratricopeptide (TPR) repeat protein
MRSNGKSRSEWARARLGHALSPRADRTLGPMPSCPSCGADIPEGFAFCGRCGAPLPSAPEAEERRVVTVLFCDLAGFTARSDHADPEDVWALLRPYHALLRHQIERFGGTLDKFIGDGVMAVFGIPVAHEDDPERAVRCALAILDGVQDLNRSQPQLDLKIRIGITTGEAVVTSDRHHGDRVVGDVVNTASRLEGVAPVGSVVVGEPTLRATRRLFNYQPLAPVRVKGKAEPLAIWRAVSARSRFGVAVERAPTTPFLGRMAELGVLQGIYARVLRETSTQLVTVVGEPGVGKSRLVWEFHSFIEAQPELVNWRQGHCLPYGEGVSFWALGEVLKAHAGILEFDDSTAAGAKLANAVAGAVDDQAERQWFAARLAPLLGLASELGGGRGTLEQHEAFTAWRRFLEAVAAKRPLVVVLEDLHWANEALLAFIQHLVEESSGVPMLIIGTARLELHDRAPGWGSGMTTIQLGPLSDSDTAQLIAALLDQVVLPAKMRTALLERVGGNPLYVEQLCRMLDEQGLLAHDGRMRRLPPSPDAVFPDSLQALIAARLDTLNVQCRALLQNAAVIGTIFWPRALSAVSGRDSAAIQVDLDELARRGLIRAARASSVEGEVEYAFWHTLTREVAYAQLPRSARIKKHREVAVWIEQIAGDRVTDYAELLAHHYGAALELARAARTTDEVAKLREPARRSLVLAGDHAMDLDTAKADAYYQRALELHSPDDPRRATVLAKAAENALQMGRLLDAEQQYREAISTFRSEGDALHAGEALNGLSDVLWQRGEPSKGRQALRAGVELLERGVAGPEVASAYGQMALFSLLFGNPDQALEWASRTMALADRFGAGGIRQKALQMKGVARFEVGDLDGLDDLREAVELGLQLGLGRDTARAYINLSELLFRHEGPAAALEANQVGRKVCEERGIADLALVFDGEAAECLIDLGDWDHAMRLSDELIARIQAQGGRYFDIFSQAAKAYILVWRGELTEAALLVDDFLPRARLISDPQTLARAFPVAGLVKQARGDVDGAVRCVKEFVATTRQAPAFYQVQPLLELIRICLAAGEPTLAEQLLTSVKANPARVQHSLLSAQAVLAEARGDIKEASKLYAEAAERWSRFGVVFEHGRALLGLGRCLTRIGQPRAREHLMKASAIFARLKARPLLDETHDWLHQITAQTS